MNKILITSLSIVLFVALLFMGVFYFAFSQSGNSMIGAYIQKEAQKAIGIPVEVRKFTLEAGKARLIMDISKGMNVEVVAHYNILDQSFFGIYHLKADHFRYQKMLLRQADITGQFKGNIEDVHVVGKGTALDARLAYKVHLVDKNPQNIEALIKGLALDELLELAAQPPLAKGKIDLSIKMPDMGKEFAKGEGHIVLHESRFNRPLIQKIYDLPLPKKSHVYGNVDMNLHGMDMDIVADIKSNLFHLSLDKTAVDMKHKKVTSQYNMDVKEMGILTQNRLSGALKVVGHAKMEDEKLQISGETTSLGGVARFDMAERIVVHMEQLSLEKISYLLKEPAYVKGQLSGDMDIEKKMQSGTYQLSVDKGIFGAKNIAKHFGYQIPSKNSFTFDSKGEIDVHILQANSTFKSTLGDADLTDMHYAIDEKKLSSKYNLFLPNIGLLIPNNKASKRGYLSLKGNIDFDKYIRVDGEAKGLGDKLHFVYDSKTAKVDAKGLFVEKLLSLATLPRYLKGKLSTDVHITNIKTLDGTFSLHAKDLTTQPQAISQLLGKGVKMKLSLESKGRLEKAKVYLNTTLRSSMGKLVLQHSILESKTGAFVSDYSLDIPNLKETYALTQKKLYGPLLLKGHISKEKTLKVTGNTHSLGGEVVYTLLGDSLTSKIKNVSVENMLTLMGQAKMVQGNANGDIKYNIKRKKGVVDIDIDAFKIKPSSTTTMVKMAIGKDPSRIIFSSTKLHAELHAEVTTYTLLAKGSHASIEISKGRIDKKTNTHRGKFKFVYETYVITGTIGGSVDSPHISIDPSSVMQHKIEKKIQKKLDKALGKDMGKAVGGFLKGLKF